VSRLPPIVLASASPRRRELLAAHGYTFSVEPAEVTELLPPHLSPAETVIFNARLKALALAQKHPAALIIGVDTLVALEGRIFGKPANLQEARWMLSELEGRVHEVFSGVSLIWREAGLERHFAEATRVRFRTLSVAAREAYLARIAPLDKAGAYAAQDDQGALIEEMEGSLSNVIGLPMEALAAALQAFRRD
jgi:septum formation protein